jgi:RND family efflux transporter MFP subunit
LTTTAALPEGNDGQSLQKSAVQAVELRALAILPQGQAHELALPLVMDGQARGVVALLLQGSGKPGDTGAVWQAAATLRWGMGWLRAALLEGGQREAAAATQLARARLALDLALAVLNEPAFKPAAMVVSSHLARAFDCSMVQLGWCEPAGTRLVARSDSAWHERRADPVRLAEQAMDEALDQAQSVALPPSGTSEGQGGGEGSEVSHSLVARSAAEHYRQVAKVATVLTVPLVAHGPQVGALLFERTEAFSVEDVDAAETLAQVLGPLLQLRHQGDESVWAHLRRKAKGWLAWALGQKHSGWKLLGGTLALVLALTAVWPVTYRVSAPALIEGQTQRAAVVPFDGFIQGAQARAGDTVRGGQVLATLDDRDLRLQRQRWEADFEVATRREREALSTADRVAMRQAAAQAESAQAQLALVMERLQRLEIRAPFDGVIVKGDLSQRLGSPVEMGDVLFELAPLEAWRVIVKVDERDIGRVQAGQSGELVLAGLPGQVFNLQTQRVLSVAEAEEGRNQFRVEAGLDSQAARLRPGMEGVAKIEVGEASLLWVWTHRLTDWLQRMLWEWSP